MEANKKYDFSLFEDFINSEYLDELISNLKGLRDDYLELCLHVATLNMDGTVFISENSYSEQQALKRLIGQLELLQQQEKAEPQPTKKTPKAAKPASGNSANEVCFKKEYEKWEDEIEFVLLEDEDKISNEDLIRIYGISREKGARFEEVNIDLSRKQVSDLHRFLGDILERTSEENE